MAFCVQVTTTSLMLLFFPVFAFFRLASIESERFRAWYWLGLWNWLAGMVALSICSTAIDNPETTANVRWKQVLLCGLMLLAAAFNTVSIFSALDVAADMLLGSGGNSSAVARLACAIVAFAAHLPVVGLALLPLPLA